MFSSSSLLCFVLAALSVHSVSAIAIARGASIGTIPFATHINGTKAGYQNLADADRARAKALIHGLGQNHKSRSNDGSFAVQNAVVTYTTQVGVGSPPTYYTLLIDTGSSNTWVGAQASRPYKPTSSSQLDVDVVSVTYGSGNFEATEWFDTVTLSPSLVIKKQSIGAAVIAEGFNGVDGILGVGPVGLTQGTLAPFQKEIPTVTDNLFSQGTIGENTLGVYYAPTTSANNDPSGELTFGGVDTSKIVGDVNYVPVTSTSPASEYWGIDQSVHYGDTTILSSTAGIVDTGTTLVLIATDAFNAYKAATGGVPDTTTGLLSITPAQYSKLQDLDFEIGGVTYTLTPNAQIWPRALNTALGGAADAIYLIVADIGSNSGSGLDFINGYTFLQRFYSVYDTGNKQVGFAQTAHTNDMTN